MDILISGCSFTHWPEEPGSDKNICWPAHLQKYHPECTITNLAEPGAGNQYIANSVVRTVSENPGKFDLVLVMWSGVSRLDFLTGLTDPAWHALFDTFGFYRRVETCPNQLGYIFSGGEIGPWVDHNATNGIFKGLYKVSDKCSLAHTNLIEIIKTQFYLQAKKIPFLFMSYVNYWVETQEYVSPNNDFGVMGFRELRPLINDIDFSKWLFLNEQRDGLYEMAKTRDDYHGDRFHPGIATHQIWAELVNQRIKSLIQQ